MQYSQHNQKIEGLLPSGYAGVLIGQNERVEELNRRVIDRISTDGILQPNFDPRPVSTKYSLFPIIDRRKTPKEPIFKTPQYEPNNKFYSNLEKGPVDGFLSNVNLESSLRNQFFALQKADQAVYVPPSNSDLYENNINFVTNNNNLDQHLLFQEQQFNDFNPNISPIIGNEVFYNSTRVQLKNLK